MHWVTVLNVWDKGTGKYKLQPKNNLEPRTWLGILSKINEQQLLLLLLYLYSYKSMHIQN